MPSFDTLDSHAVAYSCDVLKELVLHTCFAKVNKVLDDTS